MITSATVNGLEICYEQIGDGAGRPLLLIMGLGGPMIWWDDEFCRMLVDRGFHVIRYDNRDCGRSSALPAPVNMLSTWLGLTRRVPYRIDDMADDAAGLLDHLRIRSTHVVGYSMGGMIGQALAIAHPGRVLSLTSIASSTGSRFVGRARPDLVPIMLQTLPAERDAYIERSVRLWQIIGSPGYPPDPEQIRRRAAATYEWGICPDGRARQLAAVLTSADRTPALRRLRLPATVIHGAADPLVGISGGRATARALPGAELRVYPGMGHDLPRALWRTIINEIERTANQSRPV